MKTQDSLATRNFIVVSLGFVLSAPLGIFIPYLMEFFLNQFSQLVGGAGS